MQERIRQTCRQARRQERPAVPRPLTTVYELCFHIASNLLPNVDITLQRARHATAAEIIVGLPFS